MRFWISSITRATIFNSRSVNFHLFTSGRARAMDMPVNSAIEMPFTLTAKLAGFNLRPSQAGHLLGDMNSISHSRYPSLACA